MSEKSNIEKIIECRMDAERLYGEKQYRRAVSRYRLAGNLALSVAREMFEQCENCVHFALDDIEEGIIDPATAGEG